MLKMCLKVNNMNNGKNVGNVKYFLYMKISLD